MKIFGINIFNKPAEIKNTPVVTEPIAPKPATKLTPPDKFIQEPKIGNFYIEKLAYIQNAVKAIENLPTTQEQTLAEIKKTVDEINNVPLTLPDDTTKKSIVEIENYDENKFPVSRILLHRSGYNDKNSMAKIITLNKDGSNKGIACYENGELLYLFIDPQNNPLGYCFEADNNRQGMGANIVRQTPNTKNSIQYGRNMDNISEHNYTRLIYSLKQNDLTGTVMVDKKENKVHYWNIGTNDNTPSVVFSPQKDGLYLDEIEFDNPVKFESDGKTPKDKSQITGIDKLPFETNVKNFDIDKIFEPINNLVPEIFPTENRKKEIKDFSEALLSL